MIPAEVKLALYRIALFCKEHERNECCKCPLYDFCSDVFDIYPDRWEKMLAEDN